MKKNITILILVLATITSYAQKNKPMKGDLEKINQYINERNLAVCANNNKFIGVYTSTLTGDLVCSVFLGDYDLINYRKIINSKIYYVAGLVECSDEKFNDKSINNFHINLGNKMKVKYYNFSGSVSYKNRKLVDYQTTDILNPPMMNATFKTIEVKYDNIYFPEAYGLEEDYNLNFSELAKKCVQTLYNDFNKIND